MKNQFVSYEIALKLKELGFDEEGIAYCLGNGGLVALSQNKTYFITEKNSNFTAEFDTNNCIAPLWQQVIPFINNILLESGYKKSSNYYLRSDFLNLKQLEFDILSSIELITPKQ